MGRVSTALLARPLAAVIGAGLASVLGAAVEAGRMVSAVGGGRTGPILVLTGLYAPLTLALAALLGLVSMLWPAGTAARARAFLRPDDPAVGRHRAASLLLSPLAFTLWVLLTARLSLFLLSSELSSGLTGAALGLGPVLFGAGLVLSVVGLSQALGDSRLPLPRPWIAGAAATFSGVATLGLGVAFGQSSGAGHALSMLGVLTRDELDLGPIAVLGLIAAGAWAAALALDRRLKAASIGALAVLVALLGLTVRDARSGLNQPEMALAVERNAPLGSKMLLILRRLSDQDHDGFSAQFGGGDCDDRDASRNPLADDVPGNGKDEDCSGADARPIAEEAPEAPPENATDWAREKLPEHPNLVLLTIDTLRHDIGFAGYPRPISPALDRLAEESVVFERTYALASYTAKSLPPMLIGKYSSETHRDYSHFNRFGKDDTFLAERLQRAGVYTVSVQGHWYFFLKYGLERGYDLIDSSAAPKAAQLEGDRGSTSDRVSDAVLQILARPELSDRSFFLWAHYTDPHSEYVVHEGFDFGKKNRDQYDSEVAFVDHHVGRVLEALRRSSFWNRTIVIVTSDHGEAFGEHGMIRHGFELWEELVRVPMLIRVPGLSPRRVTERRSQIDLVPTVLDIFGLPEPEGQDSDFVSGKSLLVDLMNPPGHQPGRRKVFIDMAEGPHNAERRAYIEDDLKLITSAGRPLGLYDLEHDPGERENLLSDKPRLTQSRERFQAFRRQLREVRVPSR